MQTSATADPFRAVLLRGLAATAALFGGTMIAHGLLQQPAGPLSHHMLLHLSCANVIAPLIASRLAHPLAAAWLAPATVLQIILLWGWHTPPVLTQTMASIALHFLMMSSLTLAAVAFWSAVFAVSGAGRWKSMVALLVTGKLACLLGALLMFAPRPLFTCASNDVCGSGFTATPIDDQQMAGLLMLAACPLTYIAAGIFLAARWLRDMHTKEADGADRLRHGAASSGSGW